MGNCGGKGSHDVADRSGERRRDSKSEERGDDASPTSTPPPPPRARNLADQLKDAADTPDRVHRKAHRRGSSGSATGTAAAAAVTTSHNNATGEITPGPSPKPPLHHSPSTANGASASVDKSEVDANNNSSPNALSETQNPSRDSVAVRLEQGSTYVWLRSTYTNPHLKPTPLLTVGCVRELRNRNVAFQRLWGVLGEAACVIGPYATAPSPGSPLSLLEDDKDGEGEAYHVEPSFINDEAHVVTKKDPKSPQTSGTGGAAGAGSTSPGGKAAAGAQPSNNSASGSGAGAEVNEVRMMNAQHISIDGDELLHHPIVCRGAIYRNKHLWMHKLRTRCCFVFEALSGADINDCSDALIVLAPTAGAVSLSNCHRCLVIAAAAQLRVLSCDAVVLSVNVVGFPVIEKSTRIGFAPMLGWYAYSNLPIDFRLANLSLFTNNYSTVRDVTPPAASSSSSAAALSHAGSLSLSSPSGNNFAAKNKASPKSGGGGGAKSPPLVALPATNFVYVDLWELEAAVWKAMAEQRWGQLIAEADTAAAAVQYVSEGKEDGLNPSSSAPFLKALTPAQSPLMNVEGTSHGAGGADNDNNGEEGNGGDGNLKSFSQTNEDGDRGEGAEEEVEDGDHAGDDERNSAMATDGAFHSMISFGRFSPSTVSKTHLKGTGSSVTATTVSADDASPFHTHHTQPYGGNNNNTNHHHNHSNNVPASVLAGWTTDSTVPPLPRWRQSGFNGNVATDGRPLDNNNNNNLKSSRSQSGGSSGSPGKAHGAPSAQDTAALKQRGSAKDAEHLVRIVLRTVPLLPLSALRDAPSLLLDHDPSDSVDPAAPSTPGTAPTTTTATAAATAAATSGGKKKDKDKDKDSASVSISAEEKRGAAKKSSAAASRYNPLELALAIYTHTCAAPSTFGAQLIPADFFEQAWKLKLIVLTVKGGGYDVARRIARDIEASRRRCFLETVRAMLHAPPPPTTTSSTAAGGHDESSRGDKHNGSSGGDAEEEEDTFSEALWHYLRTTSLTQRCGSVLLLNTVELRCTETAVREFVAPVFYKLCEPVGQKGNTEATTNNNNNNGGGSRGLHLPWKSGSGGGNNNNSSSRGSPSSSASPGDAQGQAQSAQQLEHNVEMRRLFGNAIQRMTGQTCVAMLALMAPKNVPQSFQRPPGAGGRSIGGALTPAELDAWTQRAEEARHIFTPQKDLFEGTPDDADARASRRDSHDEPTAGESSAAGISNSSGSDPAKEKKSLGPTFALPTDGESAPQTLEERVWPQTVLLNVTVPLRYVSLLQGTLFFKSQMHAAATAGSQQMREQEPEKK